MQFRRADYDPSPGQPVTQSWATDALHLPGHGDGHMSVIVLVNINEIDSKTFCGNFGKGKSYFLQDSKLVEWKYAAPGYQELL